MNRFTHDQLKTIFTCVRKRQEECLRTYQYSESNQLDHLDTLDQDNTVLENQILKDNLLAHMREVDLRQQH